MRRNSGGVESLRKVGACPNMSIRELLTTFHPGPPCGEGPYVRWKSFTRLTGIALLLQAGEEGTLIRGDREVHSDAGDGLHCLSRLIVGFEAPLLHRFPRRARQNRGPA